MRLVFTCPVCKSTKSEVKSETRISNIVFKSLTCGHTIQTKIQPKKPLITEFKNGQSLYQFQVEGIEFARDSGFRCLFADKMGLGKTIQIIGSIYNFPDELLPALVIVKSSLKIQWLREFYNRAGILCEILESQSNYLGLPVAIASYDSLATAKWKDQIQPKTLVLDECQMIKNHNSKRTQQVRAFLQRKVTKQEVVIPEEEKTQKAKKYEMIASDLMKYHGISNEFELKFFRDNSGPLSNHLGITKCKVVGEGIIGGEILLNSEHIERGIEDEVIETILHEIAHAITPGAGHTPIWRDTYKSIGGNGEKFGSCTGTVTNIQVTEPTVKYVFAASGTPIKNNAGEYFTILNILRPEMFPSESLFIKSDCDSYMTSYGWKVGGLKNPELFKDKTKSFIIRRETEDVLPDLPKIRRNQSYTIMDHSIADKYKKKLHEFQNYMMNKDEKSRDYSESSHILAYMNEMRHLTGFAKIGKIIDYTEEFLENNPGEKIIIFMHHIDVQLILNGALAERIVENEVLRGTKILKLDSTMDAFKRQSILDQFEKDDNNRVLIAPTLSSGEGLNLQFVSHAIIGEREWNPANEEQAEGRMPRPGSKLTGTGQSIEVVYVVALNSIDEMFAEYVERKRQYMNEAMQGKKSDIPWSQSSIIKDIAEKLASYDLETWKVNNLKSKEARKKSEEI